MLDSRFYLSNGPLAVEALFAGFEIAGDRKTPLFSGAALAEAGPADLAYLDGKASGPIAVAAGAVVVSARDAGAVAGAGALVMAPHPRAAFAAALARLVTLRPFQERAPAVAPDAAIEPGVHMAPGVVVGPGARIGAGSEIGPNAVIGPGVAIGRGCRLGGGVSIRCALIGDGVTILPGAVIGEAGFGVAAGPSGAVDVPHIGRVIIQDGATLGANVAVDRGLFADTVISEFAKIDNLSHIAHNVIVGRNVVMAAFAGISGSSRIGDGAMLGGRAGVADHLTIGAGAQIAAGSAVLTDVPAKAAFGGYPAKPLRRFLRENAWLSRAAAHSSDKSNAGE